MASLVSLVTIQATDTLKSSVFIYLHFVYLSNSNPGAAFPCFTLCPCPAGSRETVLTQDCLFLVRFIGRFLLFHKLQHDTTSGDQVFQLIEFFQAPNHKK